MLTAIWSGSSRSSIDCVSMFRANHNRSTQAQRPQTARFFFLAACWAATNVGYGVGGTPTAACAGTYLLQSHSGTFISHAFVPDAHVLRSRRRWQKARAPRLVYAGLWRLSTGSLLVRAFANGIMRHSSTILGKVLGCLTTIAGRSRVHRVARYSSQQGN